MAVSHAHAGTLVNHLRQLAAAQAVRDLSDGELLRRFMVSREEEAFAALMQRHGRLVWGVCRHVLDRDQDAEDAFQATFLVLARQAGSVRKESSLGSFLYGVAYRTALSARKMARRRQGYEQYQAVRPPQQPGTEAALHELQSLLDAEVQRLPAKVRAPLLSVGYDGLRVWDAATGKERTEQRRKDLQTRACCLAPDGQRLATADAKGGVVLWDFATGRRLRSFGGTATVGVLRFSPDGEVLAVLGDANSPGLGLWDPATGVLLHDLPGHVGRVWSARFTADGQTLVTGGADHTIRLWDVTTGQERRQIAGNPNIVGALAVAPDGRLIATVGWNERVNPPVTTFIPENRVRLWDVTAGKEVRHLDGPVVKTASGTVMGFSALAFAPDGKTLITGGPDAFLRFWDPATGQEQRRIALASHPWALAFAPNGKTLAVSSGTTALRLIDLGNGPERARPIGHEMGVDALALSADGRILATASDHRGRGILVWDPATGALRSRLESHNDAVSSIALAADGRTLFSTGLDQTLRLWDLATGRELRRLPAASAGKPLSLLAVSPDGKTLAATTGDSVVVLLDALTGQARQRLGGHDPAANGAAFAPDGRTLTVWSLDQAVHVWDPATGKQVQQIALPSTPQGLPRDGMVESPTAALSPDGRLLAYAHDRLLVLLDVARGKEVRRLDALPAGVSVLAFAPDGRTLAWAGGTEPTIHLLEVATGRERRQLTGHQGRIQALVFSPDGRRLISGSVDTTALTWDLSGGPGVGP